MYGHVLLHPKLEAPANVSTALLDQEINLVMPQISLTVLNLVYYASGLRVPHHFSSYQNIALGSDQV